MFIDYSSQDLPERVQKRSFHEENSLAKLKRHLQDMKRGAQQVFYVRRHACECVQLETK